MGRAARRGDFLDPMDAFLRHHAEPGTDLQQPLDAAVVMPTLLRPTLLEAVRSIYAQSFQGRIQILIGIDKPEGDPAILDACLAERPPNCVVTLFYPGYSTSVRHGGLHPARDGGTLRSVLLYLANARRVALLDDDNWWHPDHLTHLSAALAGHDWAYALRWFVHPATRRPICIDEWESIGPDQGFFRRQSGGWVDPNCLMLDKLACEPVIRCWSAPPPTDLDGLTPGRRRSIT
jgi:hypothetical protein